MARGKGDMTYEEALQHLGQALTELQFRSADRGAWAVPERGLKVLQDAAGACSKGTMSKVFAGEQFISLDKLIWLVRAVMS
ncbi:hypothetical protein [Streptomyces sp. NPDC002187]|uniref:hypothetical protein n=1 Tax=Streptomyces sp. NPDC002187 TaxID=3364637 RepID=UPI0036D07C15